jgi:hypothetical protein
MITRGQLVFHDLSDSVKCISIIQRLRLKRYIIKVPGQTGKGGFLMPTVAYNDLNGLRDDDTEDGDPIRSKDIILE